jgi:hypothetical protein
MCIWFNFPSVIFTSVEMDTKYIQIIVTQKMRSPANSSSLLQLISLYITANPSWVYKLLLNSKIFLGFPLATCLL